MAVLSVLCSNMIVQRDRVRAANAAAMVYYYTNQPMPLYEPQPGVSIPVFFMSEAAGSEVAGLFVDEANPPTVTMSIVSPITYYEVTTLNLIVDTFAGDGDNVIVVGSHADSVPAGPGINDDGSGSSSNLEILLQYYKLYSGANATLIKNRVRFVFFGAEEIGLLGSYAYVASLNASNAVTHDLDRVVGALDHDMFGECAAVKECGTVL